MAVAVITVASPYLARPTRRVGQGIVLLLAIATMYIGKSLPTDVVGAIVLGWGVAALVHFIFGTAARRPTVEQVNTCPHRPRRAVRSRRPGRRAARRARDLLRRRPERPAPRDRDRSRRGRRAAPRPHLALDRVSGRTADPVPDPATAGRVRGVHHAARTRGGARVPHVRDRRAPAARSPSSSPRRCTVTRSTPTPIDDAWEQVAILHARAHRARPPRRRTPRRGRRREHRRPGRRR